MRLIPSIHPLPEPGVIYVMDRGYAKFTLFNKIHSSGSSYVCRVRDNSVYDVLEERALPARAAEAAKPLRRSTSSVVGRRSLAVGHTVSA